jgi:hypothetical protein
VAGVILLQAGLTIVVAGVFCVLALAAPLGLTLATAGLGIAVLGAFLPAPVRRAEGRISLLDEFAPEWQFVEFHERRIAASPEQVFDAIRRVQAREIRLFNVLTWLRRFGRRLPPGILHAPDGVPLIDVAVRGGFVRLAEDAPREIVIGMVVVGGERLAGPLSPDEFRNLTAPGFAKGAMNFRVVPDGAGSHVTTETRVHATSDRARRTFAVYWRIIQPGSAFIRRMWLRAIAARAEGGEAS